MFFRISKCLTSAHEEVEKKERFPRNTGIPAIPIDIGYKKEDGSVRKSGVMTNISSNPFVPIGMGLTTLALLGMFKSSITGNKMATQKYMRYRIYAQFGTVIALVAGFAIAGTIITDRTEENRH
uniref:HIG1 domain-containing protein n=1 Tax=Parastrongyloides trichosuri TaxID=131310 RepID=A0A0N4Z1S8_PARTI